MLKIFLCALFSLSMVRASRYIINRHVPSENKIGFDNLITAAKMILHLCRPKDPELILLLGGEYEEFVGQAFFNIVPVALIAESSPQLNALQNFALTRYSFIMYQNYNFVRYIRKVHHFIIVTSSQPLLRSILQRTKDSPWANPYGFYILIDKKTESRGCINARSYLWTAWEYDLLSVIFLCIDPDDGIVYYTFNPYSNNTPASWLEVGRAKGRNGHPWIILKRIYTQGKEMCTDLNFDKTITLNGYEIRMNAIEMEPFIRINLNASNDKEKYTGDNSEIIKILLDKLKASVRISIYNGSIYDLGYIGPNGTLQGMLADLSDGKIDIGMNTRPLVVLWKLKYTYPHTKTGLCVITQPSDEISEFVKLATFLSWQVIVGILAVCLLTYTILARKQGYGNAGMQMIRLIVCVGILYPPKINSTRIFVCMTLILLLITNALLQSHLSSLLTVPAFYRNIDSLDDLKKSSHIVYGSVALESIIRIRKIKKRFVPVSYEACKQHVENSSNAACMEDCLHAYYRIKDEDLRKSRMLRPLIQSYVTREDWPLFHRVNNIIQQMMQSGLVRRSRSLTFFSIQRAKHRRMAMKKNYRVMLLKQLAFCFVFLAIGYTCAMIAFIMELVIGRSAARSQDAIVKCKMRGAKEAELRNQKKLV